MNTYNIREIPLIEKTQNSISAEEIISSHIIKRDGISYLILVVRAR